VAFHANEPIFTLPVPHAALVPPSAWPSGNPRQSVLNTTEEHNLQRSVEGEDVKRQLGGSRLAYAAPSEQKMLYKLKEGK